MGVLGNVGWVPDGSLHTSPSSIPAPTKAQCINSTIRGPVFICKTSRDQVLADRVSVKGIKRTQNAASYQSTWISIGFLSQARQVEVSMFVPSFEAFNDSLTVSLALKVSNTSG